MGDRGWTPAQKNAIEARGGSLIISAAAGSGKTSVLVERAVGLICDPENPVEADRLLIVTFSIAAAAEVRQRISARLSALIALNPENYELQRQQALLQKARISTVHAFCLSLIKESFHDLPVSPDFAIAEPAELEAMRAECVAKVIESYYEEGDPAFFELVELISAGRDDKRLAETALKVFDFSRSHPFYESWLDEKAAMYETTLPIDETIWGKAILDYATDCLRLCYDLASVSVKDLYGADEKLKKAYLPAFLADLEQLGDCLEFAGAKSWDDLVACLGDFEFAKLMPVRDGNIPKERLKAAREKVKNTVRELSGKYLCATREEAAGDLEYLAPKVKLLFQIAKDFGNALRAAKDEKRRLDFSDLEHFALELLVERDELGYRPTQRAGEISELFDYVMVDEYQDTNEIQDLIFMSVSRRQENLFMVGDVKQSIYSFRQAMPEIFLSKRAAYYRFDGESYPAAITLGTNFRSRKEVTAAVNFIFSGLMSVRVGEIDYDEGERLVPGADYPGRPGMEPELLILDTSEQADDTDKTGLEAEAVADKIKSMLTEGFAVTVKGEERPVAPGDFCILLRSPKGRSDVYVRALARRGISAWSENAGGYLAAREVMMVVSLLKALDNPLLDIELVAALLSPLAGFTDDDIARVRLAKRTGAFYTALRAAAEAGEEKAAGFLRLFEELRRDAGSLSADRMILRVYEKTGALDIVRAMPSGETRRANLLLLVEYASRYHAMGYKRLSGFIGFVSRLEERGVDLGPGGGDFGGANCVRIMSVHKSKGLEFPVVILADTSRGFNREELRAGALLHMKYGFACVRRDMRVMKQYPTIPMQAIRLEAQRSLLSEEMRILYVALTRAKEKLVVVSTVGRNFAEKLASFGFSGRGGRLPAHAVGDASCVSDWILMALLRHRSAADLREQAGLGGIGMDDGNPWAITVKRDFADNAAEIAEQPHEPDAEPDDKIVALLRKRAEFAYPHLAHTKIPVKLAVSAAAKGERDMSRRFSARPSFLMEESLTAAERGDALHKFMQFADYKAAREDLNSEIERMGAKAYLSPAETESLSAERLRGFFRSPLADRIFASEKVWRELRFMAELGREELGGQLEGMDDESLVVVQGVADCVFIEDGAAVLVDYKTDRVKTPGELVGRYSRQLRLYKSILARSLGMPVKACILYSFALPGEITVTEPL